MPLNDTENRRTGPRTTRHWKVQRDLLAQAGAELVQDAEARGVDYAAVGINPAEWKRLTDGTAGFALLVKAAGRVGVLVEIRLGRAAGGDI